MQNTKQAIFMLGEEEYGMDIMDVNIIEKSMVIEPVSNLPKNLKGIIKLRGDIIPVYSLRRKFGLEDIEPTAETRFIITKSNGYLIAYEVDRMVEIAQLEDEQLNEVPAIVKSKATSYMKSVTNIHDRLVILMDHEGVLTEEEQNSIQGLLKK
jgi:purine-binding chemotaxis protein CheW